jgi:hypothetical protein
MPNKNNPQSNHLPLLPRIDGDRETVLVTNPKTPAPVEPPKTYKPVVVNDREVKLVLVD